MKIEWRMSANWRVRWGEGGGCDIIFFRHKGLEMALGPQSLELPWVHREFHSGWEWWSQLGAEGELRQGRDRTAWGYRYMRCVLEALILLKHFHDDKISSRDCALMAAHRWHVLKEDNTASQAPHEQMLHRVRWGKSWPWPTACTCVHRVQTLGS